MKILTLFLVIFSQIAFCEIVDLPNAMIKCPKDMIDPVSGVCTRADGIEYYTDEEYIEFVATELERNSAPNTHEDEERNPSAKKEAIDYRLESDGIEKKDSKNSSTLE